MQPVVLKNSIPPASALSISVGGRDETLEISDEGIKYTVVLHNVPRTTDGPFGPTGTVTDCQKIKYSDIGQVDIVEIVPGQTEVIVVKVAAPSFHLRFYSPDGFLLRGFVEMELLRNLIVSMVDPERVSVLKYKDWSRREYLKKLLRILRAILYAFVIFGMVSLGVYWLGWV